MHSQKLSMRQWLAAVFFVSFVAGIFAGNFWGIQSAADSAAWNRAYVQQLADAFPTTQELLWRVGFVRGSIGAALFLLAALTKGRCVHSLFVTWNGFAYGYFCVMVLVAFAAKGLLVCAAVVLPQLLVYVPLYLALVEWSTHRRAREHLRDLFAALILALGLIVGILLESYINPSILQNLLKML